MKKIILIIILTLLLSPIVKGQTYKLYQTENIHNQLKINTKTGEIYQIQDDGQKFLVHTAITSENENSGRYILYKTDNIWTYILVDTFQGKLWQCHYSVDGDEYRGLVEINPNPLSITDNRKFSIQPMTSMFQFYLINDDSGDMWKFQWSTKGEEYRWIETL